ncbi:rod shape-determining protein RodA [Croceivirga thetidis]|uniref:Rod shape-determining protein RodA n=1 Tax=Croceivirga thetidis TaxID=2721623 RepID=A0ABX1GP41_9FLAO|nr:rod shape-determining protein RodA [Croceivirga thetidis]NKI31697.1 rod shape-determining protein RodA [Croceivirga thetidis]
MYGDSLLRRIDWITILLYLVLVGAGWANIYSTTVEEENVALLNLATEYGKQLFFILLSIVIGISIFFFNSTFFERFGSIFYIISLVLLLGLFLFGKTIGGATSWYDLGFMNLQPSELAKLATIMALAKYLSDIQTDIKRRKHQLYAILIIIIPVVLILPQPDPGSALVYFALFFVLFREGLPIYYLGIALLLVLLFVLTLIYGVVWIVIGLGMLTSLFYLFKKPTLKVPTLPMAVFLTICVLYSLSVRFVYTEIFEERHRNRFDLWLGLEDDERKLEQIKKTIGYNTYQAEKAIESGGFWGKGFLEGTRTKGNFVPEQHTDYIFSSLGEEWGFFGTSIVIILYTLFFIRLLNLAERQKRDFSRMFGYGVISVLFFHYVINIGMVIGLLPTIGIPLPFFSYGGSGLLFFTAMLFIFLKLDASRLMEN